MVIYENLKPEKRTQKLHDHALKIEQMLFQRPLTMDVGDAIMRESFDLIRENESMLMDKEITPQERTERLVKNTKRLNEIAFMLRTSTMDVYESVYLMPDYKTGMMHIYDGNGHQVKVRALHASEMQTNIFNQTV
jgi:hypothetical protein